MPSCSSFTASFSPADVLSGYISVYFSLSENVVGTGSVAGAGRGRGAVPAAAAAVKPRKHYEREYERYKTKTFLMFYGHISVSRNFSLHTL